MSYLHTAPPPLPRGAVAMFVLFSLALLAGTWAYRLPLMLWDHLDLVPLYDAWHQGRLTSEALWRVHDGSHFHAAAYVVLLATTQLSGGQPWLDCLVSWTLLIVEAALLLCMAMRTLEPVRRSRLWQGAMLLLILYPGHLVNLQWGWQVAVFISLLFGVAVPLHLLTQGPLTLWRSAAAALSAAVGVAGFSTAVAMFPVAIVLIALRTELPVAARLRYAMPWVLVLAGLVMGLSGGSAATPLSAPAGTVALYALNYLGGGMLRFAEHLAAAWAGIGLLTAAIAAHIAWRQPASRPWLALALFATGAAVLTALGRAGEFGADHAFVTRYVSFSSMFWIGWLGLLVTAFHDRPAWRYGIRWLVALGMLFAVANGIHLTKKARVVHERALTYASQIVERFPAPDAGVLQQAYGDRAPQALERLRVLRRYGFAPFSPTHTEDASGMP